MRYRILMIDGKPYLKTGDLVEALPDKIQLKSGKRFELVICRVDLWNEDGTPLQVTIAKGQDVIGLDDDPEKNRFFTAYVYPIKRDDNGKENT